MKFPFSLLHACAADGQHRAAFVRLHTPLRGQLLSVYECVALSYLMLSSGDNKQPMSTTMQPFAAINSRVTKKIKYRHWWHDKANGR